jgi:hypothetical protein
MAEFLSPQTPLCGGFAPCTPRIFEEGIGSKWAYSNFATRVVIGVRRVTEIPPFYFR